MPVVLSLHDICTTLSKSQSKGFSKEQRGEGMSRESREPWGAAGCAGVGERGPCVRNLLLVPNQFRRNVKHTQTKTHLFSPHFFPSSFLSSTTTMSDTEGTKKSGYRIEYASSARAKCKGMSLSQFHSVHPITVGSSSNAFFRSQTVCRYSPQHSLFFRIFAHRASRVYQAPLSPRVTFGLGTLIPGHLLTVGV
jgi:hypothetical protein